MSALSGSSIWSRLIDGNLVVSPLLDKSQVTSSAIDLRMGTVALMSRAGSHSHIDPKDYIDDGSNPHDQMLLRHQKHERFDLPFWQCFLLHPGALVLVPTLEWINLPANLQGVVTARSSWARQGLSIATATIINPGYSGIVTLELANLGEIPIALYPGIRLCQLALYELISTDTVADEKRLQSQFQMSFEPHDGSLGKGDEAFLKPKNPNSAP